MKYKNEFQTTTLSGHLFYITMSSIGDGDIIRKNILTSVRKSPSKEFESESLKKIDDYTEYRMKFLEYRKQFEQQRQPKMNKEPFLPNWIKPEDQTDLSITYKKKGAHITDIRIQLVNFVSGDSKRRDVLKESENSITVYKKISADEDSIVNVIRHDDVKVIKLNSQKSILTNKKKSPEITKSFDSLDKNFKQIFDEKLKQRVKFTKGTLLRSAELFKTDEEENVSLLLKITADSNIHRKLSNDVNISIMKSNTNFEQTVRPIISKPIRLKNYDHIVSSAINNEN